MNYNEINKHERDARLQFDAENHVYSINGQVFKSVTNLVSECFAQFDADYWSQRKAPGMGMKPEALKEMWKRKGEEAANLGTLMHANIEKYYLGLPCAASDTSALFSGFVSEHTLKPYRTEWAIYDEDSRIAGTLDFLDYQNGVFKIYDWKRSNKIIQNGVPEKVSRWKKCAFAPISHIHDTTYWHYALQQSIYRFILEKNYGIVVSESNLVVLHPDYNRHHVVEVPYLRAEVMKLLYK